MSQGEADTVLDRIVAFLEKMLSRSKSQELTVTLCVVSQPTTAKFTMSAPSLPGKPYPTVTDGEIVHAFRGLYSYAIEKDSHTVRCGAPPAGAHWTCKPLNLWDDPPVLACDLGLSECHSRTPQPGDCARRQR